MASVHESMFFNPMMANGVVHANIFGIKDWVTPHKIAILVLLHEMATCKGQGTPEVETRRLHMNKLNLPLLQGPDMTLLQLLKTIGECCPKLASAVSTRVKLMAEGELKDMENFFYSLQNVFSGTEPAVHKTSVIGLFLRHMILAYNKLSFSQVYKLYTALQQYYQSYEKMSSRTAEREDTDMELTSLDLEGKMEKEELEFPLRDDEVSDRGPLSQKQAEYFLAQQASLLKNNENKALSPAALQKELNNLLKFNPDFSEAHYLSYLNSLRVQDYFSAMHSLLHYFDRLILTGSDSKSSGEDGFGRSLRYAALNLAALNCRFGHHEQAQFALQEAIRIAQESSDHVCLQHCLSWLYILEQMKGSDNAVLVEHSVKKAGQLGLPYLASLGIQSLVQQRAFSGRSANKLIDAMKDSDMLHWKHGLSELIDVSIAQKTAIWKMYGQSTMALQQTQLLLYMHSLESVNMDIHQNNTEAMAVVLCHLAELHAEQGYYSAAFEILKHLKDRFPPHSQHAKLWMLFDQNIQFNRAMSDGKYHIADSLVPGIAALNGSEGLYRKALVLKAQNQITESYRLLQKLLVHCQKKKSTEMLIRVLILEAELFWRSSCHAVAVPLLLKALALSREYHLEYLTSEAILHLAFSQLMLGIPDQALNVLHMAIEPILANGTVLDRGRAMLLLAKCQVASAASCPTQVKAEAFESAIQNLNEAKVYFEKADCSERIREVLYLQARLFNTLGKTKERNKCAMMFRQLHQELPTCGVPLLS
ncbi:anaphase-promoting complex subunit 5 isoform X1 [Heptranchias perlo]|uniref:anaphase-promoting complex subunit 5 isoform X1 n=1 Tax=Heptranchias perlo TaxID=212740 RepID=UPI003559F386